MRKDVILGMTIGGVMLAVVIVYITVTPSGKHKKHPVDTGGQLSDATGGPSDAAGSSAGTGTDNGNVGERRAEKADGASGNPELASGDPQVLKPGNDEKRDPVWGDKLFPKSTPLIGVTQTPDVTAGAEKTDLGAGDQTPPKGPESGKFGNGTARDAGSNGSSGSGIANAAPATQPSTPGKMHKHRIAKGENYSSIAEAYYGSKNFFPHIQRANPSVDPSRLKPGTEINLPDIADVKPPEKAPAKSAGEPQQASHHREPTIDPKTEYAVQNSDSLYRISMKLYGNAEMVDKIYALNKTLIGDNPAKLKLGAILKLPSEPSVKEPVAKQ